MNNPHDRGFNVTSTTHLFLFPRTPIDERANEFAGETVFRGVRDGRVHSACALVVAVEWAIH